MRVDIDDFQKKYIKGALIPEDIMKQFTDCFLQGEKYANVRDTVFEEMKIRQFYNEHPELEPKTDWVSIILYRKFVDIIKKHISGKAVSDTEIAELQLEVAICNDKRKVKNAPNEPYRDLQDLYDDIIWFRCDVLPNKK